MTKSEIKIAFLGGAQSVTGSRHLIEANRCRILIDCGLHQERNLRELDWQAFPVPPKSIDAVLLTHAHIDHCGYLPKLVREGFKGPVYCTPATHEIAQITLLDSANLMEEDADFKKRRHKREGRKVKYPEIPLYTTTDAKATFPLFSPVNYDEELELSKGMKAILHDAGHVLGSAMIKVKIMTDDGERSILFSGDIGKRNRVMLMDPTVFSEADYIVMESTYGDRVTESPQDLSDQLAEVVNATTEAGGNIVIPSFALERSQEILYYLNELLINNRIPHLMVFLDSPMALSINEVFKNHTELFDAEMAGLLEQKKSPFNLPGLKPVRTIDESKAINHIRGTSIIIAGSGMCTGGRVKHHLVPNITRPESTILFVAYQAVGTLGREIVGGAKEVRILGRYYPVRARIVQLNGFSSHADRDELLWWLSCLQKPPRRLFITHGEPESSQNFANLVKEKMGWEVVVPEPQEKFILD